MTLQTPGTDRDVWVRRSGALIVAAVAAYASYQHQRDFALHGGADPASAHLWPLSVDGLLVLATAGLLKSDRSASRRAQYAIRLAFAVGIAVSLAANIATAPRLAWQPVLVAGWPPVALLLAVELLAHRRTVPLSSGDSVDSPETLPHRDEGTSENETMIDLARPRSTRRLSRAPTAEQIMWEHYENEKSQGRTPTGAQLDEMAHTNNYGRAVLRRWRQEGRLSPPAPINGQTAKTGDRQRK